MALAAKSAIYPVAIVVLLLVIAAMVWKFIVAGSTRPGEDGRIAVVLAPGERALMLKEMREFVGALQLITDALAREDMAAVVKAGRAAGTGKAHDVPVALLGKLPLEFKTQAFATHRAFDTIAADAEAGATSKQVLGQLAGIVQKCVACHAAYQIG